MSFYGADVAALRGLADTFQCESAKLEATTSALRAAVTSAPWAGPDAEALRARWHGEMEAALRAAATPLDAGAPKLRVQAGQQESASAVAGAGSSGGGASGGARGAWQPGPAGAGTAA